MLLTRSNGKAHVLPILLAVVYVASAAVRTDVIHSSYYDTRENYVLLNHVLTTQWTTSIMTCAQLCLVNPKCVSFNFENRDCILSDRLCELNDQSPSPDTQSSMLRYRKGFIYARLIDLQMETFVFTTLGAKGPTGPVSTSGYTGTLLEGKVQLRNGIQFWTVPTTGGYSIEALGASGGNGTCSPGCPGWRRGGLGARIKGMFWLNAGIKLKILVGQEGFWTNNFPDRPGGGGGGTFVTFAVGSKPLIVAGGGGGGGLDTPEFKDGDPGQATQNGSRQGGTNGKGGRTLDYGSQGSTFFAGTGAGLLGNGTAYGGKAAIAFCYGGKGGSGANDNGGFGGGGYGMGHPGGGGGYSGGGIIGNDTAGAAGGGGSYNVGTSQINEAGVNKGDGRVIITKIN